MVRLELLADRVALALDGLAMERVDAEQAGDLRLDPLHDRIERIEVAALAGAEFGVAGRRQQLRGDALGVDQRDQLGALRPVEEVADDEDVEVVARGS